MGAEFTKHPKDDGIGDVINRLAVNLSNTKFGLQIVGAFSRPDILRFKFEPTKASLLIKVVEPSRVGKLEILGELNVIPLKVLIPENVGRNAVVVAVAVPETAILIPSCAEAPTSWVKRFLTLLTPTLSVTVVPVGLLLEKVVPSAEPTEPSPEKYAVVVTERSPRA